MLKPTEKSIKYKYLEKKFVGKNCNSFSFFEKIADSQDIG